MKLKVKMKEKEEKVVETKEESQIEKEIQNEEKKAKRPTSGNTLTKSQRFYMNNHLEKAVKNQQTRITELLNID